MNYSARLDHLIQKLIETSSAPYAVTLYLGELLPISAAGAQHQWLTGTHQTALAHTPFRIERVQAELQCMACFEKYQPIQGETKCPFCGSMGAKILKGEELKLEVDYE